MRCEGGWVRFVYSESVYVCLDHKWLFMIFWVIVMTRRRNGYVEVVKVGALVVVVGVVADVWLRVSRGCDDFSQRRASRSLGHVTRGLRTLVRESGGSALNPGTVPWIPVYLLLHLHPLLHFSTCANPLTADLNALTADLSSLISCHFKWVSTQSSKLINRWLGLFNNLNSLIIYWHLCCSQCSSENSTKVEWTRHGRQEQINEMGRTDKASRG